MRLYGAGIGLTWYLEVLIDRSACFSVHCRERCRNDRANQLQEQVYQRRLICIDDAQPVRRYGAGIGLTWYLEVLIDRTGLLGRRTSPQTKRG